MKMTSFAFTLLIATPLVHGGEGILSRYGADGPISKRYPRHEQQKQQVQWQEDPELQEQQMQQRQQQQQQQQQSQMWHEQMRQEHSQHQHEQIRQQQSQTPYGPVYLTPSGQGYVGISDGRYYAPAGPNGVTDTRTGQFLPLIH